MRVNRGFIFVNYVSLNNHCDIHLIENNKLAAFSVGVHQLVFIYWARQAIYQKGSKRERSACVFPELSHSAAGIRNIYFHQCMNGTPVTGCVQGIDNRLPHLREWYYLIFFRFFPHRSSHLIFYCGRWTVSTRFFHLTSIIPQGAFIYFLFLICVFDLWDLSFDFFTVRFQNFLNRFNFS